MNVKLIDFMLMYDDVFIYSLKDCIMFICELVILKIKMVYIFIFVIIYLNVNKKIVYLLSFLNYCILIRINIYCIIYVIIIDFFRKKFF